MSIEIKTPREIEAIRVSSQMAAETLVLVSEKLHVGMTTDDINRIVHDDTIRRNAIPSPLNYHGYPKSVCTSINEVVCHGIPCSRALKDGDIINVDVTTYYNGFHGDTSATFYIGKPSKEAHHLVEVTRKCLELGIAQVHDGGRIGDIGAAIQEFAHAQHCSVVTQFVGHGIGRRFHEAPHVPHVGTRGKGERMKAGMVFTIEPMINLGGWEVEVLDDDWTTVTKDGSLSAQFEHTVAVTKTGCDILTRRSAPLKNSENYPLLFI